MFMAAVEDPPADGRRGDIYLYYNHANHQCRAVTMVAQELGVVLRLRRGDSPLTRLAGSRFNESVHFPTLVDGDYILHQSRAIMGYLVDEYGTTDRLYPRDPKKRALVNHRLFYDVAYLNNRYCDLYVSFIIRGEEFTEIKYERLATAVKCLDEFLEGQAWVAGPAITIADYSILSTISTMEVLGFDLSSFRNVEDWLDRMKVVVMDYQRLNMPGCGVVKICLDKEIMRRAYLRQLKKEGSKSISS